MKLAGRGGLRRQLSAGLVDSGFASLAGFAVALTAVSLFGDADRGVYAVFFTAFVMGSLLANELILTPAEVTAVSFPVAERLAVVPRSLRLGIAPALLAALAAPAAFLVTAGYADADVAFGLAVTSAMAIVVSPLQDHVRRMLHIAEQSWRAATVSIVQFIVVGAAIGAGIALDIEERWLPFGALVVANVVSLTFARVVVHRSVQGRPSIPLGFKQLAATGVWFVLNAAPAVLWFATAAIIASLASPEALGFAESARVVAQPVLVVAAGLKVVLAPRAIRAAMDGDGAAARSVRRVFHWSMAAAGVPYLVMTGWDWVLNPMAYFVPSAYALSGLVALTVVANVAASASFLQGDELAGAGKVKTLAGISWASGAAGVLGGCTAPFSGGYARPIAVLVGAVVRFLAQARALTVVYRTPTDAVAASEDAT